MFNGNSVSLKQVLWKVMRDPTASELLYEDAAEYAIEAIELIGAPVAYSDNVTNPPLKVVQYKTALPKNVISIKGIRKVENLENYDQYAQAMLYSTDIYLGSRDCGIVDADCPNLYNYTIGGGIIKTSFEKGDIQLAYKSIDVDEEGYPLIPDNRKVKLAIEYYILYRYFEPLYRMGKITDKAFDTITQNKDWYIGGSSSSLQIVNIDHAQAIVNGINRIIINNTAHSDFFRYSNQQEFIKNYH